MKIRHILVAAACLLVAAVGTQSRLRGQQASSPSPSPDSPRFTAANELMRPADFREWMFVTSGLGMTYNEVVTGVPVRTPNFTNVYVNPSAYRSFAKTGQWPEKTMFMSAMPSRAEPRTTSSVRSR